MFEKYDPGFLPGFIGLVMSFLLGYSYPWIKILYRFSKLFTKLDELVKSNKNSSKVIELVEEARNVPWFKFIRRYQIGKSMDELISEMKAHDLREIVIELVAEPGAAEERAVEEQTVAEPGGANQEIDQAVAEPGAPEERAVEEQTVGEQLDTPEEIIIGESRMIAVAEPGAAEERAVEEQTVGEQLDTPEEIIIGESPMIAGLRRRVGFRLESQNDYARLMNKLDLAMLDLHNGLASGESENPGRSRICRGFERYRWKTQSLHNLVNFEKYVTEIENARNLSSFVGCFL